ncbi:aminotransferase class V-fold PLP-dependent enzyme [Halalkalibacterium ligniniphilum]|uniref:aminotransferase class V-fold PLP-dependent enzyme n=1 Tax=Halalkalibacterium ligniniphilum TaxID=1134413 RepID=UPI0003498E5A
MIYFDQAASSFPKPASVANAMAEAVNEYAANPGRGGHALATRASQMIESTRELLKAFFHAPSKRHVWFYQNATMALNQALLGFPFQEGDHVVSTSFEHNSVRRPLEQLRQRQGIEISYVEPNSTGLIEVEAIEKAFKRNTRLLVVSHGSNVTGAFVDIERIGKIAKTKKVPFLLDASQTAGKLRIEMDHANISMLAFAGHKGLLGPQGTGALIVAEDFQLKPLVYGGTGSYSELIDQPSQWPDRYESGTLNTPGIAGLNAGIKYIVERGIDDIYEHEWQLTKQFLQGLQGMASIKEYGPSLEVKRVGVVSFQMEGLDSHEVATILDEHYQIAVRAGLHCAPLAHDTLQTSETGLVRVSFGPYNTAEEVDTLLTALGEIEQAFY